MLDETRLRQVLKDVKECVFALTCDACGTENEVASVEFSFKMIDESEPLHGVFCAECSECGDELYDDLIL